MAKLSAMAPSKYLNVNDMRGRRVKLTISKIVVEDMEVSGDEKPVAHFEESRKALVLNATNRATLIDHFGDDIDTMVGGKIILFVDPNVRYGGKKVGGIVMEIPQEEKHDPVNEADDVFSAPDDSYDAGAVDEPGFDDEPPI